MTGVTSNPQILTIKPIPDFFNVSLEQLLGMTPLAIKNDFASVQLNDLSNKDGGTYNKPSGSGLGLYHAKKTMEQFGEV